MKKFGNKGITLVALVVTIIVLIILAGVSISLILGQDGVVQKAKEGRDSYAEAARIENEQLANVDSFAMSVQEMIPSTSTVTGEITNMTDGEIEILATVNLEGDIDFTKTKYVFTTGSNPLGTNDESLYKDGIIEQASSSVSATKAAGTYYLHVLTTSTNGAKKEIISEETATSQGKKDFDYTGDIKNIILTPGKYKLEVWGAQGGSDKNNKWQGGKGGYSYGTYFINESKSLYIVVGESGKKATSNSKVEGGYNGGGYTGTGTGYYGSGSGGGATHIGLKEELLVGFSADYSSKLLIVAGAGGGAGCEWTSTSSNGGAGGGTTGQQNTTNNGYGISGAGGTQTAGGAGGTGSFVTGNSGSFGQGGNGKGYSAYGGGGGAGLYGGGSGMCGDNEGETGGGRRLWIYKYIPTNRCSNYSRKYIIYITNRNK